MPFSLWISKAVRLKDVATCAEPLGAGTEEDRASLLARLRGFDPTDHPQDGSIWLRDPKSKELWCRLRAMPAEGPLMRVELATSFSHHDFMRNTLDMFDLALSLARRLGGRVFEERRGLEITPENIDGVLEIKGEYVQSLHRFYQQGHERIATEGRAALEVPLGAADEVGDYLSFTFRTVAVPPPLEELTDDAPEELAAVQLEVSALLVERQGGAPLVRIIRTDDGVIVRPAWSRRTFDVLSRATLRAVDRLERRLAVTPEHLGAACDALQRAELEAHAAGSGVELYEWLLATGRLRVLRASPPTTPPDAEKEEVLAPRMVRAGGGKLDPQREAEVQTFLMSLLADSAKRPMKTDIRIVISPRHDFGDIVRATGSCGLHRTEPWGPLWAPDEPQTATWTRSGTTLEYRCDPTTTLRTMHIHGPTAEVVVNDLVNVAYLSTLDVGIVSLLDSSNRAEILLGLGAVGFLGAKSGAAPIARARELCSSSDPRVADAAQRACSGVV